MKHTYISDLKQSHNVLRLEESEIAPFVQRCVKERSLSTLVSSLNHDLLFGTPDERADAKLALDRIGFI